MENLNKKLPVKNFLKFLGCKRKVNEEFPNLTSNVKYLTGSDDIGLNVWGYSESRGPPIPSESKEKHIPGYNFCGPGTQVKERLERGDYGINDLDNACRVHDVEYMVNDNDKNALMESDRKLSMIAAGISDEINKRIKGSKSTLSKFLALVSGISQENADKIVNVDLLKEKLEANAVASVFDGKALLENFGIVDPVKFASGLNDNNENGIDLYKKYIQSD